MSNTNEATNRWATGVATFIRKGKTVTARVSVDAAFETLTYVRKDTGRPFYGSTGYLNPTTGDVKTYRGALVATGFTFTADEGAN